MIDGGNSGGVWSGYGAPRVELPLVAGQAAPFGGWITLAADLHQKAGAAFLHADQNNPSLSLSLCSAVQCDAIARRYNAIEYALCVACKDPN